ncbi:uncharacterized protein LOC110119337 [Bombus terrestris]|uniref:Uncharacterized protein LOC110119337 n=1 Tax=Bombus terrestris TaxID=30195 RepID=A0A9C6SHS4_BOMTE|nr:uncharacterized protein LOC110119337 [Bombus terrestris]
MSAMSSSGFNEERSKNSEEISDGVFVESDNSLEHLSEDIKNFSPHKLAEEKSKRSGRDEASCAETKITKVRTAQRKAKLPGVSNARSTDTSHRNLTMSNA